jgi:hypothetical protein
MNIRAYIHRCYIPWFLRWFTEEYNVYSSVMKVCSSVMKVCLSGITDEHFCVSCSVVESWVSSDGKDGKWYVDIRGSKVVAPACVDWGPFVVDPWMSIWLCTDRMLDLWGPVNRRSWMIVVVGRYPTIPLEMSIGITSHPWIAQRVVSCGRHALGRGGTQIDPTLSLQKVAICGLSTGARMLCWSVLYSCRVGYWFGSSRHSRIWVIACSLPPLVEMHVYYYDDG